MYSIMFLSCLYMCIHVYHMTCRVICTVLLYMLITVCYCHCLSLVRHVQVPQSSEEKEHYTYVLHVRVILVEY